MSEQGNQKLFEIIIAVLITPALIISFYMTTVDMQMALYYLVGSMILSQIYVLYMLGVTKKRLFQITQKTETKNNEQQEEVEEEKQDGKQNQ